MATFQLKGYRGAKMVVRDDEEDQDHSVESPQDVSLQNVNTNIDVKYQRYPYCLVWTPIPLITWIFPMIGHVGICTSDGVIHDFAGSNFVSVDDFAFGDPHKYVKMNKQGVDPHAWDNCIKKGDEKYSDETVAYALLMKYLFEYYVATVLNNMKFEGRSDWNMVQVWKLTVTRSTYISPKYILRTYLGFLLFIVTLFFLFR